MTTNENSPASPTTVLGGYDKGMTMRQYYACAALSKIQLTINRDHRLVSDAQQIADFAFEIADAMIKAERKE